MSPEPTAQDTTVSRGSFLKGVAATTAAVAASGAIAQVAHAQGRIAAPYVSKAPSGEVTIWANLLFAKEQIAAFNKVYPNVKITQIQKPYLPNTPSEAATLVSGVGVPDGIFFLEDAYLGRYADALYDVSAHIAPYKSQIAPFKLAVATQNGRIVSIPEDVDPSFLIYRTDIVAKAGVDVAKIHTYDDLIAAARTVKEKVPSCATPLFFCNDQALSTFMLEGLAWQQHAGMANAQGQLQLNARPYTNAFAYLEKAAKAGLVASAQFQTPSLYKLWLNGQTCFTHFANWWTYWNAPGLKPLWGKVAIRPQPIFAPGDNPYSMMGGSGFVVPAKGKNPDLAALFGTFVLLDPRGFGALKNFDNYESVLPAVQGLWDEVRPVQQGRKPPYALLAPSIDQHTMLVQAAKNAPTTYRYPGWYSQAVPYVATQVQAVLKGQKSAQAAQSAAYHDVLTKVVQRYR
jgi:lactose/L-arabinose transport system substrate-binding protein